MPSSPAERKSISRMGGRALVAKGLTNTAVARQAFLDRFANEPDPEAARKLYFARLSLKRWQSRRRKRAAA